MPNAHDALTEIHGIGDSKAQQILDVLDGVDEDTAGDELSEHIRSAHEYHEAGDHEYAAKFVRRAHESLE